MSEGGMEMEGEGLGEMREQEMTYLCLYRLQEERLALIEQMLKQRETDHQALNDRRLEHLWSAEISIALQPQLPSSYQSHEE